MPPMAAIAPQVPAATGTNLSFTAASAGGDTVVNDGRTILVIKNTDAASHTVTVDSGLCAFGVEHDADIVVPAGAERYAGPYNRDLYGTTLALTYDAVTGVSVAAVKTS